MRGDIDVPLRRVDQIVLDLEIDALVEFGVFRVQEAHAGLQQHLRRWRGGHFQFEPQDLRLRRVLRRQADDGILRRAGAGGGVGGDLQVRVVSEEQGAVQAQAVVRPG